MIAKFMRTIRFYILPVIQAKKTRFLIVSGFIILFHIIAVLMTTGEFKIDIKGNGDFCDLLCCCKKHCYSYRICG